MSGVDFALPPGSPAGLAVIGAGVLLLILSAVRFHRLGLRGRLVPLLAVRLLATAALVLLVLGPATLSERRVDAPLAAGNATPEIITVEGRRLDGYLPPPARWSPVAPLPADRVRIRSAAPPLLALFKNRDAIRVELGADLQGPRNGLQGGDAGLGLPGLDLPVRCPRQPRPGGKPLLAEVPRAPETSEVGADGGLGHGVPLLP